MIGSVEIRLATAEEVLEFLRLDHDVSVECDEAEVVDVGFDTSVHEWFWLGDGLSRLWVSNATRLNSLFEMDASINEWRPVLTPPRKRTVRDICEFVAKRSRVLRIPEPHVLGRPCRNAGAFLTLKKLLSDAGADTSNLAPSSPLADYAEIGLPRIYLSLIRTAPQLIKRIGVRYRSEAGHMAVAVLLFFTTSLLGVAGFGSSVFYFLPALLSLCGFFIVWQLSVRCNRYPKCVVFDGLSDFKDLSKVVAGESAAAQHPTTS